MGFLDSGEAEVEALKLEGEFFVIHTQQMQHSSVKVVYGDDVLNGVVAEVIGITVADAAFDTAASQQK